MEVVVEYPYEAQESDELTLTEGDIVTNVVQKLDGWWEGTLGAKRGLFPDNFVKVIKPEVQSGKGDEVFSESVQLRKKPSARRLKALFSYSPEQDDELALDVGDVLEFISEVEDGWFKGSNKGKTGIFPSNFVTDVEVPPTPPTTNGTSQLNPTQNIDNRATYIVKPYDVTPVADRASSIEEEPAPKLPPKPVRELARCFFSYVAQNDDELSMSEGDVITVISKSCEDDGWWRGEHRGKIGLFPDNFVKLITPNEAQTASTTTTSSAPQQKIFAQGRNMTGIGGDTSIKKESPKTSIDSIDGAASSKNKIDKNFQSNKKVKPPVKDLKELPLGGIPSSTKPNPPSPVSPRGVSYLSNINLKPTAKRESSFKKEASEDDLVSGDIGDFNAVERNEKLSHLTANRAKAPKRRPPSTNLSRENEPGIVNGTSLESSIDSPHQTSHNGPSYINNNSSSFSSGSFNSTPSTVVISDGSSLSTPGSRPLQNREMDSSPASVNSTNETSTPSTGNASAAKPKKLLPWMAELKQTQDKKRGLVPTNSTPSSNNTSPATTTTTSANSTNSLNSSTSSSPTPAFTSTPLLRPKDKEKELPLNNLQTNTTKAPPLPAKPLIPVEKVSSSANVNSNPVVTATTTPTNTSTVSSVSMKFGGRKTSTPTTTTSSNASSNYVNTVASTTPSPSTLLHNNTNNHGTPTSGSFSTTNLNASLNDAVQNSSGGPVSRPDFVPYEEFAKLKERVYFLECELQAVKKQLMDRDGNKGHIV